MPGHGFVPYPGAPFLRKRKGIVGLCLMLYIERKNPMAQKLVIALGGNALQTKNSEPTAEAQLAVVKKTVTIQSPHLC